MFCCIYRFVPFQVKSTANGWEVKHLHVFIFFCHILFSFSYSFSPRFFHIHIDFPRAVSRKSVWHFEIWSMSRSSRKYTDFDILLTMRVDIDQCMCRSMIWNDTWIWSKFFSKCFPYNWQQQKLQPLNFILCFWCNCINLFQNGIGIDNHSRNMMLRQ